MNFLSVQHHWELDLLRGNVEEFLERVGLMLKLLDGMLERVEDMRRNLLPGREEQGWSFEEELASCRGEPLECRGGLRAPKQGENQ